MDASIIEIKGLTKRYGDFPAVDNLTLNIKEGEVFGLLGPNGAGKSTTIRMILGLTEPSSGYVKVCGDNSSHQPLRVKQKVGYLPEDVGFYGTLSGIENLIYTARLNRIPDNEARTRISQLMELVGLKDDSKKKTGVYSRGMVQRLGLADVLLKNPRVIILDEPTLGLDPEGVKEFLNLIVRLSKKEGITVLFSSHHLHQVQQVCDRVGIFVKGRLIADGDIPGLSEKLFSESPLVIEAGIRDKGAKEQKKSAKITALARAIKDVAGVSDVRFENGKFFIDCETDITPEIAGIIVGSDLGLSSLNKKEYGLDDIYYKYFEGGAKDEK